MPPKGPKQTDEAKEEPLRAVVVADTFETKFAPFTLEKPRCLLPLANVPLIEYTLQFLASAGVQEVYMYAGAHIEQVETYVRESAWSSHSQTSPFKIFRFLRCQASSVGDVMRDLDQKGLMGSNGDFIVVSGDVVCDFPIEKALQSHRERREKDKNAIMTMILKECGVREFVSDEEVIPTFVIDPTADRCLHYEESVAGQSFGTNIDSDILKVSEVDIRQDLIDCRIDICTADVLSLWSDNFDNQSPRKDFLHGVLKDYELNGKTIHTSIVTEHYANRVGDLKSYAEITADLGKSLSAGLTLDNNISGTGFKRSRDGALKEKDVIVVRPSRISQGSLIGAGSSLGKDTVVKKSVLGKRCQIGKRTTIDAAYVWDDTTIGDDVTVTRAIIGNEVFIGDRSIIEEGALISFGVHIAPGTKVPAGARITKASQDAGNQKNQKIVGGSEGSGWEYEGDDEDGEPRTFGALFSNHSFNDSVSSIGSDASEPDSSQHGSRSQSFATTTSDDDVGDRFQHDTVAILVQRMQEGKMADDMLSELMGLRFSGGADETGVRKAVAIATMKHIHSLAASGSSSAATASRSVLEKYNTLIRRSGAEQTTEEQILFLLEAQKDLSHRSEGDRILLFVIKDLYDLEVFTEDAFTQWWEDSRSQETAELSEVRKPSKQFIEWLESAESEEEEEDDDDDDDGDDEE